ncbi:methylenetetrahydrofolate reductase, partial [Limnoraphis robusta CCNP1324]|uniref:methylenetetrahydrofolate reductase n=1 Tax=Limnoraphis robusta TaxID=1118279 RepID=UPI002B21C06F
AARLAGDLITGELTPPRGADPAELIGQAESWAGCVDAAHVNDCLLATARMSNLAAAALMRGTGLEPVMQFSLRHRNRIALQSDLLGAHAVGVRGLVLLSGYDLRVGSDPEAKESGDLRTAQAIGLTRRFSDQGRFFNGARPDSAPHLLVGAVESIGPGDPEAQVARVEAKIAAGVQWLQVQGAFDIPTAVAWYDAMFRAGIHERARLVSAVIPFRSLERLHVLDRVPGIRIPAEAWARMRVRDDESEGFDMAHEVAAALRDHPAVSGVHIRPFGWEEVVPPLAGALRPVAIPVG